MVKYARGWWWLGGGCCRMAAVCVCSRSFRRHFVFCAVDTLVRPGFAVFVSLSLFLFFFFHGSASRSICRSAHDAPPNASGDLKDFVCNLSPPRSLSHVQNGFYFFGNFYPSLDGERECVAASASLICFRSCQAITLPPPPTHTHTLSRG